MAPTLEGSAISIPACPLATFLITGQTECWSTFTSRVLSGRGACPRLTFRYESIRSLETTRSLNICVQSVKAASYAKLPHFVSPYTTARKVLTYTRTGTLAPPSQSRYWRFCPRAIVLPKLLYKRFGTRPCHARTDTMPALVSFEQRTRHQWLIFVPSSLANRYAWL